MSDKYKFFKDVRAVNAGDKEGEEQRLEFDQEKHKRRMAAMSAAQKLERLRKMKAQGMDTSAFAEGGMVRENQMGNLENILASYAAQDTGIPEPMREPAVEPSKEDVQKAETAQINEQAKAATMKTQPELAQDQMVQEAAKTPQGQAIQDMDPKAQLMETIQKYKEQLNAPKKEYGVMDALPDILAGAYNIGVRANPTGLAEMKMPNTIQGRMAQDAADRKEKLSGLQNLQAMQAKLMEMQQKGEKAKKEDIPFAEKERIKAEEKQKIIDAKDKTKTIKEAEKSISDVDSQIQKIEKAMTLMKDMVDKSSIIDTGPLDQYVAGTTKEGQQLRQAFNDLSLEKMTKMFAGMSKAIDSDAERKMFEQSQASLSNYPEVNMQILQDMLNAAKSLKNKNKNLINELQGSGVQEVKRRTKDGKIAIFDAKTKEFIRYEK